MFLPLNYIPGGTYFARPRISPPAEESNLEKLTFAEREGLR